MNATDRRLKNIEHLKQNHIPYIEHLPVIEESSEINIRSKEEILKRALTCLLVIQVAFDYEGELKESRKFFSKLLKKFKVKDQLTPNEQSFFEDMITKEQAIHQTWKYEAILPLFWALGFYESLPYPETVCDSSAMIQLIQDYGSYKALLKASELRDIEDILDEADLIYRYDWACVEARINGRVMPAGLDSGVVMERHYGLNWLIGKGTENDDWDHVDVST